MRQLNELKRGFWGYKKDSVYNYIMVMEEKVSDKLAQKDAQAAEERELAENKIRKLEKDIATVKAENEELRREQKMISDMLIETKRYSEGLKAETLLYEKKAREEIDKASKNAISELDLYKEKVGALKETLRTLLQEIDGKTKKAEQEIDQLRMQNPVSKVTPIRAMSETEAQEKKAWIKSSFM